MATVLLCPGLDMSAKEMQPVAQVIERKGYQVVVVPIAWARNTVSGWIGQLRAVYNQYQPGDTILAGYSYGAVTALALAADCSPQKLWLFSLSARFAEDLPHLPPEIASLINRRCMKAFASLSFDIIVPRITCPTLLFMGEHEPRDFPQLARRVQQAARRIQGAKVFVVQNTSHEILSPDYLGAIAANV